MKGRMVFKTALVVLILCSFFYAAPAMPAGESITFTSNIGGSARHGITSGNYLYSLIGSKLYIHNVSDMANPVPVGSLPLPGQARRADRAGGTLYIACSEGGLVAVDVTDPANPQQIGVKTFDTSEEITNTFDVEVHGNLAYVADYNGFFILDVTNPAAMAPIGSYTAFEAAIPHLYGVHVNGDYAYVCCEFDGLYIFNIANPAAIALASHYSGSPADGLSNQYYDSLREGNYLYLGAGGNGFAILDVSDVTSPGFVSLINNDYGGILGLVKSGNFVYPFSEFYDQPEIDVSDPANPVQTEVFDVGGNHSLGISLSGDYMILANSTYGIRLLDISGDTITQVGAVWTIGRVMDCEGKGNYAFVAAAQNGLQVLDMTDPAAPSVAASFALIGYANGLALDGDTAYIAQLTEEGASGGLLEIVDVSNPLAPVSLGSVPLAGEPNDVTIHDDIAYVAVQTEGITLVDVSNPASPSVIAGYNSGGSCLASTLWGQYLIGADGPSGFFMLKPDGTTLHKVAGVLDLGVVQDIAVWDTALFLPGTVAEKGLSIYDLTQPYAPGPLAQINGVTDRNQAGQIKAVAIEDSYLMVADSVGGLRLFDIAILASPMELASTLRSIHGDPVRVTYNRDQGLAYVPSQIIGLYIYDVALPAPAAVDLEGRWIGTGRAEGSVIGISAELNQAHDLLAGTVTFYIGSSTQDATVAIPVTASTTIADVIAGVAPGGITLTEVQMSYAGVRGYLNVGEMTAVLDDAVTAQLAATSNPMERIGLNLAQPSIEKALAAGDLSSQLTNLAFAELFIAFTPMGGAVAPAVDYLNEAAFQESLVAQSIAQNQVDDICSDYERELTRHDDRGDRAMAAAVKRGAAAALAALGRANRQYEAVSAAYLENKPNCPEWGIATFDGYYVGTVNFLGIISGIFKVCADEDEAGNITGDVFIEIEASGEYMGGPITEATNSTASGISVINGVFTVQIGDNSVPILIQEWKYDPAADTWIGTIYVEAQKTTGNITLKRMSDLPCPEGWNNPPM